MTGLATTIRSADSQRRPAGPLGFVCQACGAAARVHVLIGYEDGKPSLNRFCMECAADRPSPHEAAPSEFRERLRLRSVLMLFGAALALLGFLGAVIGVTGTEGFGWYQRLGVCAGVLIAICGGLLRAELLALAGAILVGTSAGVDLVASKASQWGLWFSWAISGLGLICILVGLFAVPLRAAFTAKGRN